MRGRTGPVPDGGDTLIAAGPPLHVLDRPGCLLQNNGLMCSVAPKSSYSKVLSLCSPSSVMGSSSYTRSNDHRDVPGKFYPPPLRLGFRGYCLVPARLFRVDLHSRVRESQTTWFSSVEPPANSYTSYLWYRYYNVLACA